MMTQNNLRFGFLETNTLRYSLYAAIAFSF